MARKFQNFHFDFEYFDIKINDPRVEKLKNDHEENQIGQVFIFKLKGDLNNFKIV
jgi:disulfide oxidoreductase YuzD